MATSTRNPVDAATFAGLPRVARVAGPDHLSLDATYYDTADLRLARAGGSLRRTAGAQWRAAVAGADVHVPIGRSPDDVPGELVDLVLPYTGGRPLVPCAEVTTQRQRWRLLGDGDTTLAEVGDDTVYMRALDRQGTPTSWRRLSVDAADRAPDDLRAQMTKRLHPTDGDTTLLARTFGKRLGRPARPHADRRSTAGEAVTAYLARQVERLRAGDVAVRSDGEHAVHDMRVAVRRLRATLRTFRPVVGAKRARAVGAELAWLSDVLGDARDAEVLGRLLAAQIDATPVDLVLGPVRAEVDRALERRAADTHTALPAALSDGRYLGLLDAVDALVADPNTHHAASLPARTALPRLVRKAYRKAARTRREADQAAAGPARDAALHQVRKAAKRLRYAAEVAAPVIGAPAKRTARHAKRVQRVLGDHHDLVVVRSTLRDVGIQAHLAGTNAFTFGLLHGRSGAQAQQREREFAHEWRRATKHGSPRWLR